MKRFYRVTVLLVLCAALLCACGKTKDNEETLAGLFDENGEEQTVKDAAQQVEDEPEDETDAESEEEKEPEPVAAPTPLPEAEAAALAARYGEAQGFYDDMLMQNFPLDNMDKITVVTDDYENEAYRVLLDDVNSLDDLKAQYGAYFTPAFIGTLDFSAYTEKDGKLYCLSSGYGSNRTAGSVRYGTEQIDENHAVLIVVTSYSGTSKTGTHRVPCEKIDGTWYFGGVAG